MRNLFDQYSQPENKLTHSFISCIYEDKNLLKSFLNKFCKNFFDDFSGITIKEQTLPNNEIRFVNEKDLRGLPDAIIYNENKCLIIESKVSSNLEKDQLQRHENTIVKRGYEIYGIAILIEKDTNVKLQNWDQIKWTDIYNWIYFESFNSFWAKKLEEYFRILENSMVETGYLKEGSITEFTGIHFDENNPYSPQEGRRQLKLLMNILKDKKLEKTLNINIDHPGRGGIKKEGNQWDFLTFNTPESGFTSKPHLTIGLNERRLEADLTIPNGIKKLAKQNLKKITWEEFIKIIKQITLNYHKEFGTSKFFKPHIVIAQRRYMAQSSKAINDSRLFLDLRTAFSDLSSKMKHMKQQEEWLRMVYNLMNNKKEANIQMQIGARFYYYKDGLIYNKKAIETIYKSFLATKPLIKVLFDGQLEFKN